jgi:hypothetical protein
MAEAQKNLYRDPQPDASSATALLQMEAGGNPFWVFVA